jgi:hypothetical protein
MFHPFKGTIISLYIVTSSCILISRHDHVLSFFQHVLLDPSPYEQLLKPLCFSSAQHINIINMIPNNMNRKINIPFSDFYSAGSSLQFVTTNLQTSYHNLSLRFLSPYSFNFLLYKGGGLSTSHTNFSVFYDGHSRMPQYTRLVHLTAVSKQLFR